MSQLLKFTWFLLVASELPFEIDYLSLPARVRQQFLVVAVVLGMRAGELHAFGDGDGSGFADEGLFE